jgi:membrane protease YdiL (CAAX protease family)
VKSKTPLVASVAIIALYWVCWSVWKLLGPHTAGLDIIKISLNVVIRTTIVVALVWSLLRWNGESIRDLGLVPDRSWTGVLRLAVLSIGLFVLTNMLLNPLFGALMPRTGELPIASLFADRSQAPYWIFSAIVGGGFAEELARAFVLTRFEKLLGRGGLVAALLIDSVAFGLGHLYQGPASAVSSGVTGLLLGLIFLSRRRVIDAMIVHAVFDLMGIAAAYALYSR